jgi:hypothetical protein
VNPSSFCGSLFDIRHSLLFSKLITDSRQTDHSA